MVDLALAEEQSRRGFINLKMTAAAAVDAIAAFDDMDQVAAQMEAAMDGGASVAGVPDLKKKIDLVPRVRGRSNKLSAVVESVDDKSPVEESDETESSDSSSPPASVEFDRSTNEDASNLSAPTDMTGWTKEMKKEESIRMSKKKKKAAEEDVTSDDGQSLTKSDGGISAKSDRADSNRILIEETTKLASIITSAPKNEEDVVPPNDAIVVAPIQPKIVATLNEAIGSKDELSARIPEPASQSSKNQVRFKGLTSAVSSRMLRKKKTKGSTSRNGDGSSVPDKRASFNLPPKSTSSNTSRKDKLSNLRRIRVLGRVQSKLQAKRGVKSKPPNAADKVPGSPKTSPTPTKGNVDFLKLAANATTETARTLVEDSPQSSAASVSGTSSISKNDPSDLINETCLPIPPAMPAPSPTNESADDVMQIDVYGDIESDGDSPSSSSSSPPSSGDASSIRTVSCSEDSYEAEDIADDQPEVINENSNSEEAIAQNGPDVHFESLETLNDTVPDDDGDTLNMLCATDSHGIIDNSKGAVLVEVSSFNSGGKDTSDHIEVIKCIGLEEVAAINEEAEGGELREGEVSKASGSQQESSKKSSPSKESSKKSGTSRSTNCSSNRNGRSKIREAATTMMKNGVVLSQAGRERSRSKNRISFRKKTAVTSDKPDSSSDKTNSTKGLSAGAKEALRAEEAAREEIRELLLCQLPSLMLETELSNVDPFGTNHTNRRPRRRPDGADCTDRDHGKPADWTQ